MALCLVLDTLKVLDLIPDPHKVCASLLLHSNVAVNGRLGPIA